MPLSVKSEKCKPADLSEPEREGSRWLVKEQLYPEVRGFIPHYFDNEAEALTFSQTGEIK